MDLKKALKERLAKAKYTKRTGSPGRYKYQYARPSKKLGMLGIEGKRVLFPSERAAEAASKQKAKGNNPLAPGGTSFKHSAQLLYAIERINRKEKGNPKTVKETKTFMVVEFDSGNRYRVETNGTWKQTTAGKERQKKETSAVSKDNTVKGILRDWDTWDLVEEINDMLSKQDKINYVAEKTKTPPTEIEEGDITEFLGDMPKSDLVDFIVSRYSEEHKQTLIDDDAQGSY